MCCLVIFLRKKKISCFYVACYIMFVFIYLYVMLFLNVKIKYCFSWKFMYHPNCHVTFRGNDAFISMVMMNEDFVELFIKRGKLLVLYNQCWYEYILLLCSVVLFSLKFQLNLTKHLCLQALKSFALGIVKIRES